MSTIKQILPVSGSWYRVLGTKTSPKFERIQFWAVVEYKEDGDVIVGIPREDLGVGGSAYGWREDVAGYVEMTASDTAYYEDHPDGLEKYNLIWEGE